MPKPVDTSEAESLSPARRALRNFGKLFRGRGVAAALELITIGLLARVLTPERLGFVVLVQAYALIVRGLLDFNLYEVLVRFGVPLLEARDDLSFKQLLRLSLFMDVSSTAIAAVIAMLAAPLVGKILGWDGQLALLAIVYSAVLLTYGFGTAKGVLRIFDRYDVLGIQLMIGPFLRLAGVLLVIAVEPSVLKFVIALALATGAANIYLIVKAWIELRRQVGIIGFKNFSLKNWRSDFPGLSQFIGVVYWQSNLDMLPKYLATLLAGTLLGAASAGYFRIAFEATKIVSKPGGLLRQVLFPDLVRMWVRQSREFGVLLVRALLISASVGLAITVASIFGARFVLSQALGEAYAQAAPLLSLMLFAATMDLLATVLRAAGYAMGYAGKILRLHLLSAVIYLGAFTGLTPLFGLTGPGLAACIGAIVPLAGIGLLISKRMHPPPAQR